MPFEPPKTHVLHWCPECGRDDRKTFLRVVMPHNKPTGGRCPSLPVKLKYALVEMEEPRDVQ